MTDDEEWSQALDLPALGQMTARWLEGDGWAPWQCGAPADEETWPLVPYLAAMNRAGYLTVFSQPGEPGDDSQRASVDGYCD